MVTRELMKDSVYVTEHNPKRASPYVVRVPCFGSRTLDERPIGRTMDAYGEGATEEEAFEAAMRARDEQKRIKRSQLSFFPTSHAQVRA